MALKQIKLRNPISDNFYYEEAIKTLRTNIMFSGKDNKVILFTSTYAGEGKSSIIFSLAVELGKMKKKVLLLDADIRNSVFLTTHGVSAEVAGLSQYLCGQVNKIEEIVFQTNFEKLHVITAGVPVPNPVELLGDSSFAKLVKGLRNVYDYILIDCPPMELLTDSAVIGQHSDAAVMIVESGTVSYRKVQKGKKKLENYGCKYLGTIINKVEMKKERYGRYDKYGEWNK